MYCIQKLIFRWPLQKLLAALSQIIKCNTATTLNIAVLHSTYHTIISFYLVLYSVQDEIFDNIVIYHGILTFLYRYHIYKY